MGNKNGLLKFLQNKNTVTVIGVVAAVLVLYVGYNIRVKNTINPIILLSIFRTNLLIVL